MTLSIHKKGQGNIARLTGGTIAAAFCFFAGKEIHVFLTKYMNAPEVVGVVAGCLVFAGCAALGIYYLAISPKAVDYLIETEVEMRKVNWPTRPEVAGSTAVVIGCVIILSCYVFVNDLVIGYILQLLRIY
jgi:preprotein translocase subunit SecE